MGILASEENEEAVVELYFREIRFTPIPAPLFKWKEPKSVLISRAETVLDLTKKLQRALNNRLFMGLKERSVMVGHMRLWKSNTNDFEEIEGLSKKYKNYT